MILTTEGGDEITAGFITGESGFIKQQDVMSQVCQDSSGNCACRTGADYGNFGFGIQFVQQFYQHGYGLLI